MTKNNNHKKSHLKIAMLSPISDPLAPIGGREIGGVSVYIYELVKHLSKLGIEIDVYTRWDNRRSDKKAKIAKNARVIRLKAGPRNFISQQELGQYLPEFVEHFLEYVRLHKKSYNVIHTHQYLSGMIGLQLKSIFKLPVIHTVHTLAYAKQAAKLASKKDLFERVNIEKDIFNNSDCIISTSPPEKVTIIQQYGVDGGNIKIIPAGVNLKKFYKIDKDKARAKMGLDPDKKIILFAARMDENKGLLTLLKVVNKIKIHYPELYKQLEVLVFSGDPRKTRSKERKERLFKNKVVREITKLKIGDAIKLDHGIDQEKLHMYYCCSDVVAMPSYYESFGMVAIEAMASGAPVVASKVGGLQWVVQDGITGYHAKPRNVKEFTEKIVAILKDDFLEKRLRENAAIYAKKNFAWKIIASDMLKTYKNNIKNK